ncbi:MAG: YfiM family protein [Ignavibacteria bacterium]|nr:YfiM family protein [Ignavibacteria bacterium]
MKNKCTCIVLIFFIASLITSSVYSGESAGDNEIKLKLKEKKIEFANLETGNFKIGNPLLPENVFSRSVLAKEKKLYKINPWKMTALGVVAGGIFTGLHIYYSNTWWKDKVHYFKFAQDGFYARNMDKASHIYTANAFTVITATGFEWAGLSPSKSLLYGAITSMAYETYIEVNDGLAPNWGFDWVDMGANLAGALYPFLQNEVKPFRHINFKWSFKPEWVKKKTTQSDDLLDDYTNMTFWVSVNPMIVLPKSITNGKFYPKFLAFALGMSLQDASHVTGSTNAQSQWFISIDWDVNQLPGKSDFMKKLKKILNFYHFPAPAVRISPSGIWYGLYF